MTVGVQVGGKPVNLEQLQAELVAAGVNVTGLGMDGQYVFTYDAQGVPSDFRQQDTGKVQSAIHAHAGKRKKTDKELKDEFNATGTTAARKQEIRDMRADLLEREQVPM